MLTLPTCARAVIDMDAFCGLGPIRCGAAALLRRLPPAPGAPDAGHQQRQLYPDQYVSKLAGMGSLSPSTRFLTSSMATAYCLRERTPTGGRILSSGEVGFSRR